MMKILLIQSYLVGRERPIFPLGLSYIVTVLSTKHQVNLIDLNTENEPFVALKDTLDDFSPDVVGISLRNIDSTHTREVIFYYEHLEPTVKLIKETNPKAKVVIGGPGFSMFAKEIMEDIPNIDIGVFLEGEQSMPELLDNLENPESVAGLFIRKNGKLHFTGVREFPPIDDLPEVRRNFVDIKKYLKEPYTIGVQTKRGCMLKCAYCTYPFLNGPNIRLRSPEKVVDEIADLVNWGVQSITFVDSVFNIPQYHAEAICEEILRRKIEVKWTAWFNEKPITKEFMLLAKKAGCTIFHFSPDACTNEILRALDKNITEKDLAKINRIVKEIDGIRITCGFFANPPKANFITLTKLMFFYVKTKLLLREKLMGFGIVSRIRIEPHTKIRQIAIDEGVITEDTDLLEPSYYSHSSSRYIEWFVTVLSGIKMIFSKIKKGPLK